MKDKKRANLLSAEKIAMMEEIGFEWVKGEEFDFEHICSSSVLRVRLSHLSGQNKEKERRKQQQMLEAQKQKELNEEREQQCMAILPTSASMTLAPGIFSPLHLYLLIVFAYF